MAKHSGSIGLCLRAAVVLLAFAAANIPGLAAQAVEFGDIETFASVPAAPGFPEGVAVHGNRVFVSGPAMFGRAGTGPSKIHVYNRNTGALVTSISVSGEALAFEHALANVAVDGDDRRPAAADPQ